MESFLKILQIVIWPVVTLIGAVFVVILFRGALVSVLRRTKNLELWKLKIETMAEYVGPDTLAELRRNPGAIKLEGERRHVTLIQAELLGQTDLSERTDAERAVALVREYSSAMIEVVYRYGGTLDRYAGRELTAYWGAPVEYPDAAERACDAAVAMREAVFALNARLQASGEGSLRPRIAVTSGDVVVGNIGSERHFRYSVLGETLEILSGLASIAGRLNCVIVLTEFTRAEIADRFRIVDRDVMGVKGKTGPVRIYELVGRQTES